MALNKIDIFMAKSFQVKLAKIRHPSLKNDRKKFRAPPPSQPLFTVCSGDLVRTWNPHLRPITST
jgi:hypothetical protein